MSVVCGYSSYLASIFYSFTFGNVLETILKDCMLSPKIVSPETDVTLLSSYIIVTPWCNFRDRLSKTFCEEGKFQYFESYNWEGHLRYDSNWQCLHIKTAIIYLHRQSTWRIFLHLLFTEKCFSLSASNFCPIPARIIKENGGIENNIIFLGLYL